MCPAYSSALLAVVRAVGVSNGLYQLIAGSILDPVESLCDTLQSMIRGMERERKEREIKLIIMTLRAEEERGEKKE